jgi:Na+/melibiose symporter-like transporter
MAYTAIFALGTKLNGAFGAAAAFTLLGVFGYRPELGAANDPGAVLGLKATYIAIPVAINLAALYFVWTFPIDRGRQEIIRRRLEAREARAGQAVGQAASSLFTSPTQ